MITVNHSHGNDVLAPGRIGRVMLVDFPPIARLGLQAALGQCAKIQVDDEAPDGASAVVFAQNRIPDAVLVDVRLPQLGGLEIAAKLRAGWPAVPVILVSEQFDNATILRGLEIGVSGFVLKSESSLQIGQMTHRVVEGHVCCSPGIEHVIYSTRDGFRMASRDGELLVSMSSREREMLRYLAEGLALKVAAKRLGISYKSADHVKQTMMRKLGMHDRVELVRFAIRNGIVA